MDRSIPRRHNEERHDHPDPSRPDAGQRGTAAGTDSSARGQRRETANPPKTIPVQLLAINDLHGNLEAPQGSSGTVTQLNPDGTTTSDPGRRRGIPVHGAAAGPGRSPNSLTVAAGDMIGASPLLSAAFHDEPTILAANEMGVWRQLGRQPRVRRGQGRAAADAERRLPRRRRLLRPGEPVPGRGTSPTWRPTSSTTTRTLPLLPPVWIKNVGGAKIGFIGMTLKDTPNIVTASGVAGLTFKDEVQTANFYAKLLKLVGVNAVVSLIHQGGEPASSAVQLRLRRERAGQRADRRHRADRPAARPVDRRDRHRPHPHRRTSATSRTRPASRAW